LNGYPSVAGEYKGANAVVVATVLAEGFVPSSDKEFYDGTMYRIRVDRVLHGNLGNAANFQ
jgi:hypothetical protein